MRNLFLCVLACLFGIYLQAQEQRVFTFSMSGNQTSMSASNVPDQKEIGKAGMEFVYDYSYLSDTTDLASETKDQMLLQVTYGMSKFTSYRGILVDSLLRVSTADQIIANPERYVVGQTFSLFKNYPAGKFTTTDRISTDWLSYEENIPMQEWTIDDESAKEILGYQCRRATCDFRGRKYIAWYSDEIPVAEGPWKFGGLPGLIMEVSDSEGHYKFALVGINSKATRNINIADIQYVKTTRDKFYSTKRKFDTDPVGYLQEVSGVALTITHEDGTPNLELMSPRELQYDYIERDYKR